MVIKILFIPPQCTFLKHAEQNFRLFFHKTWGNDIFVQKIRIYEDEKNICQREEKGCKVKIYTFPFLEMGNIFSWSFCCLHSMPLGRRLQICNLFLFIDLENGLQACNACLLCSKSSSSQSFLRPTDRINQNHTLCWRRHVSNFVTSSWKHMFMLSLSVFSKSLYISTKSKFNHLNNMKKFRYGQPMKHTSGKQMLHLRVAQESIRP